MLPMGMTNIVLRITLIVFAGFVRLTTFFGWTAESICREEAGGPAATAGFRTGINIPLLVRYIRADILS